MPPLIEETSSSISAGWRTGIQTVSTLSAGQPWGRWYLDVEREQCG